MVVPNQIHLEFCEEAIVVDFMVESMYPYTPNVVCSQS